MTSPSSLLALEGKLVEAKEGSRVTDAFLHEAFELPLCTPPDCFPDMMRRNIARVKAGGDDCEIPRYTSSIDAALALVSRCLPGAVWHVMTDHGDLRRAKIGPVGASIYRDAERPLFTQADAATPALAICLALIRSLKGAGE